MKLFSGKMLETLLIEQRRYSEGLLPEIIKRLINCSEAKVDSLRIPDGDDVWAPGYDGIVSTEVESRYIASGKSVWEFGCSSDSLAKIESDFEKRTKNSLGIDKANTTFYLVVPKIWAYAKAISEWEAEHREEWKNVIVYDAAILCDWINSELAVAAWLFEIYDKGAHPIAISSISRAWRDFSKWTNPAFTYVMFTEGREEQKAQLTAHCKESQICCVRADTQIDAYGFCLATLMQRVDLFDAAIVVQNEDTYHRLCASCKGNIFLLAFPYHGSIPEGNTTIFCKSREMPNRPDEIDLPPLWKSQFIRALCDMGISHTGAEELYISTHGNLWSLIRKIPGSYACAMYLSGMGVTTIQYELEKAGRLTALGKEQWFASYISKMLRNSFYCGIITERFATSRYYCLMPVHARGGLTLTFIHKISHKKQYIIVMAQTGLFLALCPFDRSINDVLSFN